MVKKVDWDVRSRILEEATRLFAERGVSGSSLSAIAFLGTTLCFVSLIWLKNSLIFVLLSWTLVMGFDGFGPAAFKAGLVDSYSLANKLKIRLFIKINFGDF